jgi:hypothetical protein
MRTEEVVVKRCGFVVARALVPQIDKLADIKQTNFSGLTRLELIECINVGLRSYLCNKVRAQAPKP